MVSAKPNRKQRRSHLQPAGRDKPPEVIRYEALKRARSIEHLMTTLCSAWWADFVGFGGRYLPNIKCFCTACQSRRQWPSRYVGSAGVSWECFLEHRVVDEEESYPRMTEATAAESGLHHGPARRLWRNRTGRAKRNGHDAVKYVPIRACENCIPGMAQKNSRYCAPCEASVRQTLLEDGWSQVRIDKWVSGDDSAMES